LGVLQRRGFFSASFKKGFVKLCYKSFPNYHPIILGFLFIYFLDSVFLKEKGGFQSTNSFEVCEQGILINGRTFGPRCSVLVVSVLAVRSSLFRSSLFGSPQIRWGKEFPTYHPIHLWFLFLKVERKGFSFKKRGFERNIIKMFFSASCNL
jgi:hypothetical protein